MLKKIRKISLTVDEKVVVVNDKHKLAYFMTEDLIEAKSKSVFDSIGQEEESLKKRLEETECIDFLKSDQFNLLNNIPTSKNEVVLLFKDLKVIQTE
jgi:hypothetical protein